MIDRFDGPYRWLSNFYPVRIQYIEEWYPSVEHAYQAAKSDNPDVRKRFLIGDAKSARAKGRRIKVRADWNSSKLAVMEHLLRQKFQRGDLRAQLLSTGDQELVEGNWWGDQFWGVYHGKGDNYLGKLLMKIREELRAPEAE